MAHITEKIAKRRRASASKNRTGCGTCKIRHKRCDEVKPICDICRKTGRICDGYIDPSTGQRFGGHADRNSLFFGITPRTFFANEVEAQGFRFFETATEIQLAAALHNHGWTPPLLQLSHQDPAIRHAVIANGIMSRRYQASEISASIEPQTNNLYQAALRQYCKAIACFRSQLGAALEDNPSSLETAPACFVLLIMFEFMQGNAAGLIVHLQNAAKLTTTFGRSRHSQSFINLLALIEMVAAMWLGLDLSRSDASLCLRELSNCSRSLSLPNGLGSLYHDLFKIKHDVMAWRHAVASTHRDITAYGVDPKSLHAVTRWTIQSQLDTWHQRFVTSSSDGEDKAPDCHSLLRVNYLVTVLIIDAVHQRQLLAQPIHDDSIYSREPPRLDYFNEIIESAAAVLETGHSFSRYHACAEEEPLEAAGLQPLFSFRHSFIQPLFYVAQHAPQATLRQRASQLLMKKPWREGAWDSYIMGSIAKDSLGGTADLDIMT